MQKIIKLIGLLLVVCVVLSVSGCSSSNNAYDEKLTTLENRIHELEQQIQDSQDSKKGFTYDEIVNGKWVLATLEGNNLVPNNNGNPDSLANTVHMSSVITFLEVDSTKIYCNWEDRVHVLMYSRDGNAIIFFDDEAPACILVE